MMQCPLIFLLLHRPSMTVGPHNSGSNPSWMVGKMRRQTLGYHIFIYNFIAFNMHNIDI